MAKTNHDLQLPSTPRSVGEARRFVTAALAELDAAAASEVAALLTSEIVTNAVVHAGGDIRVRIVCGTGRVRISVEDRSPVKPAPREAGEKAVTGRGLNLVEHLAASWGVDDVDAGKVVWFELDA